jgi:hypothetical protein
MEINIDGKLYIYFIKSLFESNKKVGIEIIINNTKSDFKVIDGLKRLDLIKNNKIQILNNNYPKDMNLINTKYLSEINISVIDNHIKINSLNVIKIDKDELISKKVNTSIYVNKYATGKNKTVYDIMSILKST